MRRRTLGADLSLTATGLVVWNGTKVLHWELVKTKADEVREDRIDRIADRVLSLALEFTPEIVAIEDYAFSKPQNATLLGEVGGTVKNRLHRRDIPFVKVQPMKLKAYAGHGSYTKEQMVAAAQQHDASIVDHNVADAFWAAKWAWDQPRKISP